MSARRLRNVLIAAATAAPLVLFAGQARAQFSAAAGLADAFRPEFLDRDVPLFVEQLKLEDWQRPIIEMLLQDYTTTFQAGVEQMKEEMKESALVIGNTGRTEEAMETILEPIAVWDAERRQLRDEFLLNVKAQLSSDQTARWPRFERCLRREKELPKGELSGEAVDLSTMMRSLRMPYEVEETVDPLLVQYELELDGVLEARRRKIDSLQDSIKDAMTAMDFDRGLEATAEIMERRVAVRQTQDRWIEQISAALPVEYAETFRRNALERGYPKAFRPTSIPRLIESVRTIEDLSPDQLEQLDRIERGFDRDLTAIENRIVEKMREIEPEEPRRRVERLEARRNGDRSRREPSEVDKLVAEKGDLVDRTRREILAILTPEQTGALRMPGEGRGQDIDRSRRGGMGGVRPGTPEAGQNAKKFFKEPPKIESAREGGSRTLNTPGATDKRGGRNANPGSGGSTKSSD